MAIFDNFLNSVPFLSCFSKSVFFGKKYPNPRCMFHPRKENVSHRFKGYSLSSTRLMGYIQSSHRLIGYNQSSHKLMGYIQSSHRLKGYIQSSHRLMGYNQFSHRKQGYNHLGNVAGVRSVGDTVSVVPIMTVSKHSLNSIGLNCFRRP